MRRLLPVILALLLGLSMAGHGAVRLSAATATSIVLCTGDGAVTVTLGPGGAPVTGPHHHCPDCLPLPALAETATGQAVAPQRLATRIAVAPGRVAATVPVLHHPPARGPPNLPVA